MTAFLQLDTLELPGPETDISVIEVTPSVFYFTKMTRQSYLPCSSSGLDREPHELFWHSYDNCPAGLRPRCSVVLWAAGRILSWLDHIPSVETNLTLLGAWGANCECTPTPGLPQCRTDDQYPPFDGTYPCLAVGDELPAMERCTGPQYITTKTMAAHPQPLEIKVSRGLGACRCFNWNAAIHFMIFPYDVCGTMYLIEFLVTVLMQHRG